MSSNKLHYTIGLCLLVITLLISLSFIPEFAIGERKFRKIDLLADIRSTDSTLITVAIDSTLLDSAKVQLDSVVQVVKDKCKPGLTCIEDYSPDSTALKYFQEALYALKNGGNKALRIGFYGDSFIEGDVFCGSMRDTLQTIFGGEGVGYVPITSEVAGFRNTIKHQFENWRTFSLITRKDTSLTRPVELGPTGFCFVPQPENQVVYKPSKQRYLRDFNTIKLYYKNEGHAIINYTLNDTTVASDELSRSGALKEWRMNAKKASAVKFQFEQCDSLSLFGASFEGGKGVYVDNFSMRGNSGIGLYGIPDSMYEQFNSYRDYKLIIIQYGLNVVLEDSLNYTWYAVRMIRVVNKIKKVFPKASIILVSVSDRSSNTDGGEFKTMKAIMAMRNAQRLIAQKTEVAFWDLFEGMGGENSMVRWAEAKPALAAKDYTHLTFKGGKKLSGSFVQSLLYEQEKYEHERTAKP